LAGPHQPAHSHPVARRLAARPRRGRAPSLRLRTGPVHARELHRDDWRADVPCPPNTYLIFPPGVPGRTLAGADPVVRYCVHFDWAFQGEWKSGLPWENRDADFRPGRIRRAPKFVPRGVQFGEFPPDSRAIAIFEQMALRWLSTTGRDRATCRALLLEILLLILGKAEAGIETSKRWVQVAHAAEEALNGIILEPDTSIRDRLTRLGISYEHAARCFRGAFGATPLAYVNHLRLERAKILLEKTGASVKDVARKTGFRDAGYFGRIFRAQIGVTPATYRARHAEGFRRRTN